jgi:hypothetical protein
MPHDQISLATIQGQLDAVTHLCAALAAIASPAASSVVIAQAERAIEHAKASGMPAPYVAGYAAAAQQILAAVNVAAEAEKIRSLSGDAKH